MLGPRKELTGYSTLFIFSSGNSDNYSNFAYSSLACVRIGTSGAASFQRVRKSSLCFTLPSADSFLAQKIEIAVATATNIDDGGQISREVIRVSTFVIQREAKRDGQRELRLANE